MYVCTRLCIDVCMDVCVCVGGRVCLRSWVLTPSLCVVPHVCIRAIGIAHKAPDCPSAHKTSQAP